MYHRTTHIREATAEDAAVIAEIYNASIRAGDATMDDEEKAPSDILRQMKGFTEREGYLVLERADGYILGWGVVKPFGKGTVYRNCCETSVYLRRTEVRKGYGSEIMKALLERCRAAGYRHLVARIFASNHASITFHRQFGFEMVGIQKEIGYKHGQWRDIALMQWVS